MIKNEADQDGDDNYDDERRRWLMTTLPELTAISLSRSIMKVSIYFLALSFITYAIIQSDNLWTLLPLMLAQGLLFAHGLELQHECLHDNMFRSKTLNYLMGVAVGIPMLVSFTHYKVQHLHHHKYLGTEEDKELFDYDTAALASMSSLIMRAWNIQRFPHFVRMVYNCLLWRHPSAFKDNKSKLFGLMEYILITALASTALIWALRGHSVPLVVWLIPLVVFAEPIHYLIELPEHIFCNKGSRSITENSRSYKTNALFQYIINYNNYHAEHHLYPKVAVHRLWIVNERHKDKLNFCADSYRAVLAEIVKEKRKL